MLILKEGINYVFSKYHLTQFLFCCKNSEHITNLQKSTLSSFFFKKAVFMHVKRYSSTEDVTDKNRIL